ncbi:hypothetical protein, partial [uncultured Microbacterium sp.]|uniref:hypothetical protein n=1 Tax=uncultured Microbacterium sp. TaxID=191216 RepID=UPI0025D42A35
MIVLVVGVVDLILHFGILACKSVHMFLRLASRILEGALEDALPEPLDEAPPGRFRAGPTASSADSAPDR